MNILVIDVGTSSIRGVLYNKNGDILFVHQIEYQVNYMPNGMAEQNTNDWSDTVCVIVSKAVDFAQTQNISIDGLSLTSQRSSIIPMGYDSKPLRNAIMWQDKRNADIVNEFSVHQDFVHKLSGARINTVFSGTKMTWFKRNEPDLYNKTMKICTIADYIINQITGEFATDHTYGARSLLMNIRTRK